MFLNTIISANSKFYHKHIDNINATLYLYYLLGFTKYFHVYDLLNSPHCPVCEVSTLIL